MHYSLLVVVPNDDIVGFDPEDPGESYGLEDAVCDMLDPYSESLLVDPYVVMTREKAVSDLDAAYRWSWGNHLRDELERKGSVDVLGKTVTKSQELEALIRGTLDDDDGLRTVGESWAGYEFDDDMNVVLRYNPDSKWDWYEIGGRWYGLLDGRNVMGMGEYAGIDDPRENHTFHVLTPAGWTECGEADTSRWEMPDTDGDVDANKLYEKAIGPYLSDAYTGVVVDIHI